MSRISTRFQLFPTLPDTQAGRHPCPARQETWFTANCRIDGDDKRIVSIAVPAEQVQIHDTWKVFGMKATGSHDFSIESVTVSNSHTFSLFNEPLLDEPIFHCPLEVLASLSFASVAIGIAQHALNEFKEFAEQKLSFGSLQPLTQNKEVQQRIEQAENFIFSAKERLYRLAEQVWAAAEKGTPPEDALRREVQQAGVEMVQNCVEAANLLKTRAGMMAVFENSAFGRAWRDLNVLSQHIIVSPA